MMSHSPIQYAWLSVLDGFDPDHDLLAQAVVDAAYEAASTAGLAAYAIQVEHYQRAGISLDSVRPSVQAAMHEAAYQAAYTIVYAALAGTR